jgi:DNA-binding NarL/FixJ family response regulator
MALRILLVDNHEIVRRGLRALLESDQELTICAEAHDGREAVELAILHKPNIALIDVELPTLSGIEATRQIRRGSPATEVLIFTMHDSEELIADALHAGARGYLLKTDPDKCVLEAVNALARHRPYFSGKVSQTLLDTFNSGTPGDAHGLTGREREVVRLIAEGNSSKRVALMLGISLKTVETHRSTAMRKLNIRSVADLTRYALRNRLLPE